MLLLGVNPLFAYKTMIVGGVGSAAALSDTLAKMFPIALIGFGVMVTFRCKLWNLGGEGQFYASAIGGALTGILIDVTNMPEYLKHADLRAKYFCNLIAASTTIEIKGLVNPELMIEVDVIAVV